MALDRHDLIWRGLDLHLGRRKTPVLSLVADGGTRSPALAAPGLGKCDQRDGWIAHRDKTTQSLWHPSTEGGRP
jgi:hypothetical protein